MHCQGTHREASAVRFALRALALHRESSKTCAPLPKVTGPLDPHNVSFRFLTFKSGANKFLVFYTKNSKTFKIENFLNYW